MSVTNPSRIHGVDADALCEAVEAVLEGDLHTLVEFDRERFNPLYVSAETRALYEDEAQMDAHFESIHGYVNLDLTEMELFTRELVPAANRVRAITTALDVFTLVRVYVGDRGFFLALDPDEHVEPVLSAIETSVGG